MFNLNNVRDYEIWREKKLSAYPAGAADLLVNISSLVDLDTDERRQILSLCDKYNMAVYQSHDLTANTTMFQKFAEKLGMYRLDHHLCTEENGVSKLTVADNQVKEEFIPYSDRPIGWHTDGYYNQPERNIYGLMLHCVQPAPHGGVSAVMDHEIAYILLRDENPDYIRAFMAPDCMTIPPYIADGVEKRPECKGPVFSIQASSGKLHMRYTERKRNIIWKDDPLVKEAIAFLTATFINENSPYVIYHKLEAGQGLVCNNVLHIRTGFTDDPENPRLLYRARSFDRVTDIAE